MYVGMRAVERHCKSTRKRLFPYRFGTQKQIRMATPSVCHALAQMPDCPVVPVNLPVVCRSCNCHVANCTLWKRCRVDLHLFLPANRCFTCPNVFVKMNIRSYTDGKQMQREADEAQLPELNAGNYVNRELSWIEFNRRVLAQALDERVPLLERIKFLSIVSSNTDEFFMVRVASIQKKFKLGLPTSRPDGIPHGDLLKEIRARTVEIMNEQRRVMRDLLKRLAEHGISILPVEQLSSDWKEALRNYFFEEVFPVLTPLAVDHARPFPFISNLSMNLAVCL